MGGGGLGGLWGPPRAPGTPQDGPRGPPENSKNIFKNNVKNYFFVKNFKFVFEFSGLGGPRGFPGLPGIVPEAPQFFTNPKSTITLFSVYSPTGFSKGAL